MFCFGVLHFLGKLAENFLRTLLTCSAVALVTQRKRSHRLGFIAGSVLSLGLLTLLGTLVRYAITRVCVTALAKRWGLGGISEVQQGLFEIGLAKDYTFQELLAMGVEEFRYRAQEKYSEMASCVYQKTCVVVDPLTAFSFKDAALAAEFAVVLPDEPQNGFRPVHNLNLVSGMRRN